MSITDINFNWKILKWERDKFTPAFMKALKKYSVSWFKLSDWAFNLKPCDVIACYWGKSYFIELKQTDCWDSYESVYKHLRSNQIKWLQLHQQDWGMSYVVNHCNKTKKTYWYLFKLLDTWTSDNKESKSSKQSSKNETQTQKLPWEI